LPEGEREYLLQTLNDTGARYPLDKCIHELFEEQVAQTPDNIAVVYEDEQLTYAQLNARANRLAHYLREQGVQPDSLVGLCLERGVDMVVGIVGILKSGAAYVPLDPDYPQSRLSYMAANSKLSFLLSQDSLREKVALIGQTSPHLNVENVDVPRFQEILAAYPDVNLERMKGQTPTSLAYVIYTSGSTGQPKGVMVEHASLVNLNRAEIDALGIRNKDRILHIFSFGFDPSVGILFSALNTGARLYLTTPHQNLSEYIDACGITHASFPASVLAGQPSAPVSSTLRIVTSGGGVCPMSVLERWAHGRTLINLYGPTEATIFATSANFNTMGTEATIGKAINNVACYVMVNGLNPAPVGAAGELYIGGDCLARGYLNEPYLTADRFVANPFRGANNSERLYKTGDLVRYLADGNIEFLGRIDDQVKIRGFRIELGEIENQLARHPDVESAVVLARAHASGEKQLVAYVATNGLVALDSEAAHQEEPALVTSLKAHLRTALPDYMVPVLFVILDRLPLTPNGKVDKAALAIPDSHVLQVRYVAPQTQTERALVEIWAGLLQVPAEDISITANFFALGGHSLLLVKLASEIRSRFHVDLDLRDIFVQSELQGLAEKIDVQCLKNAEQSRSDALILGQENRKANRKRIAI
jgi:amino acid adenylation domain-containing protein